ncbi:hypothetical protein P879_03988 [Paragonimus westermani]|uniref:Uncharacterized protein n=1 Tax=Paragonimus westermani TaxID=34504 RepID=A0A8T0E010_9TREM|nr:hypothetical protein P879_03988 [Paragonimus westermani]
MAFWSQSTRIRSVYKFYQGNRNALHKTYRIPQTSVKKIKKERFTAGVGRFVYDDEGNLVSVPKLVPSSQLATMAGNRSTVVSNLRAASPGQVISLHYKVMPQCLNDANLLFNSAGLETEISPTQKEMRLEQLKELPCMDRDQQFTPVKTPPLAPEQIIRLNAIRLVNRE